MERPTPSRGMPSAVDRSPASILFIRSVENIFQRWLTSTIFAQSGVARSRATLVLWPRTVRRLPGRQAGGRKVSCAALRRPRTQDPGVQGRRRALALPRICRVDAARGRRLRGDLVRGTYGVGYHGWSSELGCSWLFNGELRSTGSRGGRVRAARTKLVHLSYHQVLPSVLVHRRTMSAQRYVNAQRLQRSMRGSYIHTSRPLLRASRCPRSTSRIASQQDAFNEQ
ncbi:hypothetical protein BD414DRAFT_297530 [Trametes punicea]|nr:hypothetical protein BD414DRAFT_297530 [Trametes punicea]